ncbi:NAD-specific glutamate dehydrogenase [archaeon HR01]|nr:NAD-specific glutamate dehydrogenase [archaeon HR01]
MLTPGYVVKLDLGKAQGWLVIDFFVMGVSWGGIRILPDVTRSETELLARMMTLKSALAGIPVGGAKIGIAANPWRCDKISLIKRLAYSLRDLLLRGRYIAGTDMGFWDEDLQYLYSLLGVTRQFTLHKVGDGVSLTGIAVATSLCASIDELVAFYRMTDVETVALEGFGNMGSAAAKMLEKRGYTLIAVSNRYHTLLDEALDIQLLLDLRRAYGEECLRIYREKRPSARLLPAESISSIPVDIFIPGTRPLTISNKPACMIIAPLSNYPMSMASCRELEEKGVHVIPDIISTAGGSIGSALTLLGRRFEDDLSIIDRLTRYNIKRVLGLAQNRGKTALEEAYRIAWRRIKMLRLLGPYYLAEYMKTWVVVGKGDLFKKIFRVIQYLAAPS